ncbi:hypothetical protein NDU88_007748 [Pleurodeles waltl]|uniref:Secreted peptide n=1 Tax=Pleurodeles waltl TaxID=8319 RepID=A0AAV7N4C3_PLEWA|nr:hypothetical protein NDU88_007748 [Pleurodeles waltl]
MTIVEVVAPAVATCFAAVLIDELTDVTLAAIAVDNSDHLLCSYDGDRSGRCSGFFNESSNGFSRCWQLNLQLLYLHYGSFFASVATDLAAAMVIAVMKAVVAAALPAMVVYLVVTSP